MADIVDDLVTSYAQNREDVLIAGFFKDVDKGFYVDIGAHHPVNDSVTKYFYNLGWSGINVEPNKRHYNELVQDRPRDINVNVGIAEKSGKLKLRIYDNGDGLSTFSDEIQEDYEKQKASVTDTYHEDEINVITLKELLEPYGTKKIHFLKIDIEGYEYNALIGNDWDAYRPELICIEANHVLKDWRALLKDKRYKLVFFDGLNEYYIAEEAQSRAQNFSYVKSILGRPIISLKWREELVHNVKAVKHLEYLLKSEQSYNNDARLEIARLHAELREQRRIKNLVKILLRRIDAKILSKIESLNQRKRKHVSRGIDVPSSDIEGAVSREDLIGLAQSNDRQNFYNEQSSIGYNKAYVYKILNLLYRLMRKAAKSMYVGMRKIKTVIKGDN